MINSSLFLFVMPGLVQLSVQQPPVLSNLQFQPHLDVQQQVVIRLLLLEGDFQLLQLDLQHVDGPLQLAELTTVSTLHFLHILLHALNLQNRQE